MTDDVPPARQCTMPRCSREAENLTVSGALCHEHVAAVEDADTPNTDAEPAPEPVAAESGASTASWTAAAAADSVEPGTYPPAWDDREQWMAHTHGDKKPFAPWADRDHPDADAGTDARWKWGLTENYTDLETAREWAEKHPDLAGVTYLLGPAEEEPFAFVDGDDVRDPETGEWHPEFVALLEDLGLTYADISTSGTGVHAAYEGDLPDGTKQAKLQLDDEPWGANDDVPVAEIYDHKKVCVATGEHVPHTPTAVREWDDAALRERLEEHGLLSDPDDPVAAHEQFDSEDYEPDATGAGETTDDIRDVFAALDRLDAQRVADRTIVHRWNDDATTSDGERAFIPTWGRSANGTANIVNDERWVDTGGNGYGGVTAMAAIDAGLADERIQGAPSGEDWFEAVEHLRELGFGVPELERTSGDAEPVAVLPDAQELNAATSGWDWQHTADRDIATVSLQEARDRTAEAISTAYETGDRVLIEALPTTGKSYGSIKAVDPERDSISIFTGRGQEEQYEQYAEWCEEFGLSYKQLPAFTDTCPTAGGEHGAEIQETVMDWYRRGATPQEIHNRARHILGLPLPCQVADDGTEIDCPHRHAWSFDPDDYDVLIGHYDHAHTQAATGGRTAVFDEFPDAYETVLGERGRLAAAVSQWLERTDGVPFEDWADLRDHRKHDQQRRAEALLWFKEHGVERDPSAVFEDEYAHADAPLAVFTLLAGEDLGNGFEHADLCDAGTGVYSRETDEVAVLQPPALEYVSGIVALDGTPTEQMWELALGERLNRREVLADGERAEYLEEALNLNLVRTTEYVKPYNYDEHVTVERDAALLEKIADEHGAPASVITTATAEDEYEDAGFLERDRDGELIGDGEHINTTRHHGNVLGSNELDDVRLGAVIGSNHYGDGFIKKWGAYAGEAVERTGGKGADLSYTGIGDDILQHMREHDTLQAAMRFGRDGNGAVVYVHTDTLPEWAPLASEGHVVTTWSDGMRDIVTALEDLSAARTADVVDHPAVDLSRQQAFDHLETLRELEGVTRERDPDDGRALVWRDDGLHRLGDHGVVALNPLSLEDLTADEVRQLARTTIYTWEFTNLNAEEAGPPRDSRPAPAVTARGPADGGDPPPDDPV